MITWFVNNLATILISLGLTAIITFIIIRMVKDRIGGKSSCGCSCASCPMGDKCHSTGTKSH